MERSSVENGLEAGFFRTCGLSDGTAGNHERERKEDDGFHASRLHQKARLGEFKNRTQRASLDCPEEADPRLALPGWMAAG